MIRSFFTLLLLLVEPVRAQRLLIPFPHTPELEYFRHCSRFPNRCTPEYFADRISSRATPEFDGLIDSLDRDSPAFRRRFAKEIGEVLKTENLDARQLDLLLDLLREFIAHAPEPGLAQLLEELRFFQDVIKNSAPVAKEKFVMVFKTRVAHENAGKLQKRKLDVPVHYIHFRRAPVTLSSRGPGPRIPGGNLLSTSCPNPRVMFPFSGRWAHFDECRYRSERAVSEKRENGFYKRGLF